MTESALGQDVVRNLSIPPRPDIVTVLFEEMSRDVPDFPRISKCIAADVGLSAAMLKVCNSPALGLQKKASSISMAI
jgi:HD-like signal output (HDOD) protein